MVKKGGTVRRQCGGRQGFTLFEVLVAVLILSMAYVAVLQNFSQSMANIFHLDNRRAADLEESIAFSALLRERGDVSRSAPAGEILVEGQKFVLRKIFSDGGGLETVTLEKR
ncbi:type IV pilus modification PilV family protein [Thiovibrio sp. JS02]